MPVGKNSIKRVSNNGYSQVATSAPDMENSTVVDAVAPEVKEKTPPKKKTAPKKPSAKNPMAKNPIKAEPTPTPVSDLTPDTPEVAEEITEIQEADGFTTVPLGEDLPYYLL